MAWSENHGSFLFENLYFPTQIAEYYMVCNDFINTKCKGKLSHLSGTKISTKKQKTHRRLYTVLWASLSFFLRLQIPKWHDCVHDLLQIAQQLANSRKTLN